VSDEREVKLAIADGSELPALDDLPGDVIARPDPEPATLATTYFDTADLRLAAWGCSLRFREGQGWTVKLPPSRDGVLLLRDERTFEGAPGRPPADAVDLVRAFVRTSRLATAARLRTERTRLALVDPTGRLMGEVVDDRVSVLAVRRVAAAFREVEVEIPDERDDDVLAAILVRLRAAGAEPDVSPRSKYLRALGDRAAGLSPELGESGPGRDPSVAQLVGSAMRSSVARMLAHDPAVRLAEDPEGVHQARVATRRLRSDLRTFGPVLDTAWAGRLRDELRWYGGRLGVARDADVLIEVLVAGAAALPERDAAAADRLIDRMRAHRAEVQEELRQAMRSRRYVALLDDLVAAAHTPAVLPEAVERPARSLGTLMERPWKHLENARGAAWREPTDADLHEVRIRAKRARYAAEALTPAFGNPAQRFARAAAELQSVLGLHQDAVIAAGWLGEQAAHAGAGTAFVAGELAGLQRAAARDSRDGWRRAWKALDRAKLRFWT
jgi:CHAD domain-containing protein